MFRIRKSHYLLSLIIVFSIGLSLRLLVPTHTFYPGKDPWRELASLNYIRSYGFDLRGDYYHASEPVLQLLLLTTSSLFGDYNSINFLGPIYGWTLSFVFLYLLCRRLLDKETTLFVSSLFSTMAISFQSLTVPEQIALPIGIATIFFFHKDHENKSLMSFLFLLLVFSIVTFTHNLTTFCVLVALGACVLVLGRSNNRSYQKVLLLVPLVIFILYWEHYQGYLLSFVIGRTVPNIGGTPQIWPKPLWWWAFYLTPHLILALILTHLGLKTFLYKEIRSEIPIICIAGGSLIVSGIVFTVGLFPWRILNQFSSYFAIGAFWLPKTRKIAKILIILNLMGLLTAFPITNMNDYYVGGYWINHSEEEVSALRYLGMNATPGVVVIDHRCGILLEAFLIPPEKLQFANGWVSYEVYNLNTTKETWDYCIQNNIDYIFVSKTYEIIAEFGREIQRFQRITTKFSKEQLIKFSPPYFGEVFNQTSEAWVYKVNIKPWSDV